jgi:hypothetical protein
VSCLEEGCDLERSGNGIFVLFLSFSLSLLPSRGYLVVVMEECSFCGCGCRDLAKVLVVENLGLKVA